MRASHLGRGKKLKIVPLMVNADAAPEEIPYTVEQQTRGHEWSSFRRCLNDKRGKGREGRGGEKRGGERRRIRREGSRLRLQ